MYSTITKNFPVPSIAQLVERWTVVVKLSIGRWFESGSKDKSCFFFTFISLNFFFPTKFNLIFFFFPNHYAQNTTYFTEKKKKREIYYIVIFFWHAEHIGGS